MCCCFVSFVCQNKVLALKTLQRVLQEAAVSSSFCLRLLRAGGVPEAEERSDADEACRGPLCVRSVRCSGPEVFTAAQTEVACSRPAGRRLEKMRPGALPLWADVHALHYQRENHLKESD